MTSWLDHNGVPPSSISRTHGGGWLTVTDVPVSQANELMGASYQLYYHDGRNDTILRTASYALPAALHVHVKTIIPTTAFTPTRPLQQTSRRTSGEAVVLNATSGEPVNMLSHRQYGGIDPSALRGLYQTTTYVPPVAASSRLGIVAYNDDHPNLKDQERFMRRFMTGNHETITWGTIDQNVRNGQYTKQTNMFAQFAAAISYPIPITFYRGTGVPLRSNGNRIVAPRADDAIHQWLKYAVDQQWNPHTIGLMSVGISEQTLSPDYMDSVCDLFKLLGSRGVTILVPSGDDGVGDDRSKTFYVHFPASCTCDFQSLLASCTQAQVQVAYRIFLIIFAGPFVTSVGGTTGIPEVASFFSGGGFSSHFTAENYQKDEVDTYITRLHEYTGRYTCVRPCGLT